MLSTSSGGSSQGVIDSVVTLREDLRHALRALLETEQSGGLSTPWRRAIQERCLVLGIRLANVSDDLDLLSTPYDPGAFADRHEIDFQAEAAYLRMLFPEIGVTVVAGSDLGARINRPMLRQILRNLVGDAIRRGRGRLLVYVTRDGTSVTMRVSEPGPPDSHELSIVALLVRAHGGTLGRDDISDALLVSLPSPSLVTSSPSKLRRTS